MGKRRAVRSDLAGCQLRFIELAQDGFWWAVALIDFRLKEFKIIPINDSTAVHGIGRVGDRLSGRCNHEAEAFDCRNGFAGSSRDGAIEFVLVHW